MLRAAKEAKTMPGDDINGRLFETMLEYASFRLGPETARGLFEKAALAQGVTLANATDARGWAKLDVFHAVADAYRPLLGERFLADAITWAVPVRRDFSAMSLSSLTQPATLYRHLDRARTFFARHVEFAVEMRPRGLAHVKLSYREGVPRRRESCDVGRGILIAVPLLFALPVATVEESACFADGADACAFTVRWAVEPRLSEAGFVAGGMAALIGWYAAPHVQWAALPLVGWLLGREARSLRMRRHVARLTEEHRRVLEKNERDFELRFREIKELNEHLEERVGERTQEIHSAMEELRERNAAMRETIDQVNRINDGVVEAGVRGLLGDTVQKLAHEIRSPMSYLVSNLDYLESATNPSGPGSTVPLTELTEVVRDARLGVDRMRAVLAWFLELHQDERATDAPYDLNEEIRQTLRVCESKWAGRIVAHLDLVPLPMVQARGKQLSQVIFNLVMNASQAMASGNVWLTTRQREGRVILSVKDDGVGISPENVDKVLERGFTTKPGVGSGLGLYIARAIVERHGGRISVQSKLGEGAVFEVQIPLIQIGARSRPE